MQPERSKGSWASIAGSWSIGFLRSRHRSATDLIAIDPKTSFSIFLELLQPGMVVVCPFLFLLFFLFWGWFLSCRMRDLLMTRCREGKHNKGLTTYVAGTLDRSVHKGNEGSLAGMPSAHCPDTPYLRLQLRTAPVPDRRQVDIQWEVIEDEHHPGRQVVAQPERDPQDWVRRPGWPGQLEQRQHARAPQQPCAGPLPPSSEPSTLCGSP